MFIDADNAPVAGLGKVFEDLAPRGVTVMRRAYGNWAKPHLTNWQQPLLDHAVQAVQQFDHAVGKNATDMALTIDVMDLLHSRRPDVVALVSSDADFTPLAVRLRSVGVTVIGYGGSSASDAFRRACTEFVECQPSPLRTVTHTEPVVVAPTLTVAPVARIALAGQSPERTPSDQATIAHLPKQAVAPQQPAARKPAAPKQATPRQATPQGPVGSQKAAPSQVPTTVLRGDTTLMNRLRKAVTAAADSSGWAALSVVGQTLSDSGLAARYGYASLSRLLRATDAVEWRDQGKPQMAVRLKQPA